MESQTVRVLVYASPPRDTYFEFTLLFEDNYEKYYCLQMPDLAAFSGMRERDIVAEQAMLYFDSLGQPIDELKLVFL
jgi:hypothetical protein